MLLTNMKREQKASEKDISLFHPLKIQSYFFQFLSYLREKLIYLNFSSLEITL